MVEKSYNKTFIDFNFGRHKDLSTRKSTVDSEMFARTLFSLIFANSGPRIILKAPVFRWLF